VQHCLVGSEMCIRDRLDTGHVVSGVLVQRFKDEDV
jgi:hypothetical protein